MKTNRKAQIRLQNGDYRVGNFVFHDENNHVKCMDISGMTSWRVSADTSVGMLVRLAIKEKHDVWLKNYAAMMFSMLCLVPDNSFFAKHADLINAQVAAHPEYYGKPQPTDDKEEDDRILQEERELHEEINK